MFRTRLGLQRLESRDNPSDIIGLGDPTYDPTTDPTDPTQPTDPVQPIDPGGDPTDPVSPYGP